MTQLVMIDLEYHREFAEYWCSCHPRYLHNDVKIRQVVRFLNKEFGIVAKFKRHEPGGKIYLRPDAAAIFKLKFG